MARGFIFSLARAPPKVKFKALKWAPSADTLRTLQSQSPLRPKWDYIFNVTEKRVSVKETTMNKISDERKKQILSMLVEGSSIRSIERITNTHRDTIIRLMVTIGNGCQNLLDSKMRDFHSKYLQADEIWTFVKKKQRRLKKVEKRNRKIGDQYVFVALDAESKLIPLFTVGKRNSKTTRRFIVQLKRRLNGNGRVQITTDSYNPYEHAIEKSFGADIDYAQQTKFYSSDPADEGRYSPPQVSGMVSKKMQGKPDEKHISTSYVERHNLTMRMQMRRFTRLTNAFSKKLENLKACLALYFAYYNFIRIHNTIKMTPAMQAEITGHIWTWDEILAYEAN